MLEKIFIISILASGVFLLNGFIEKDKEEHTKVEAPKVYLYKKIAIENKKNKGVKYV